MSPILHPVNFFNIKKGSKRPAGELFKVIPNPADKLGYPSLQVIMSGIGYEKVVRHNLALFDQFNFVE
jgi:hypothetical protein